ncbi:DUF397 domain-containing protein [Streptomyces sp. NPDC088785]|uniref:DUF397 domain-containing protein n=1 Tax=Streptomyces sp. NPDC088785 TaxID=3365897 RepID=UPI00382D4983
MTWRKSSYSGNAGGECVECAPLEGATWHKSSYSSDTGGQCVEYTPLNPHIALRDSKNPGAGLITVRAEAFAGLVRAARRGEL